MAESFEGNEFLGPEFLLWLWYQTETAGGLFELPELGRVGVAFDRVLELQSPDGSGKVTVRGETPTRLPEAGEALCSGRLPSSGRLLLAREDTTYEVTLDALTFDLRSVKVVCDEPEVADDPHAADEERISRLFLLPALLDGLFARFLRVRSATDFATSELRVMQEWVRRRHATRGARSQDSAAQHAVA